MLTVRIREENLQTLVSNHNRGPGKKTIENSVRCVSVRIKAKVFDLFIVEKLLKLKNREAQYREQRNWTCHENREAKVV